MKVCVIGLGYIGFPTACIIAQAGHEVIGVDVNQALVTSLANGELHIVNEDGLADLADSVLESGKLRISTVAESADVFVIAVPTPFRHDRGQGSVECTEITYVADLSYVQAASRGIAPYVRAGDLVILESTVSPGTTEEVVLPTLTEEGVDVETVLFAHAPERVLPGNMVHELVHNDRIVGGTTPDATQYAVEFYQSFVQGQVVPTNARTAELVKLMENTYRDVNIALANEFALVCEHLDVDVWQAIQLANLHPRVNFLRPGPGVGGHCIAVDPYFVVEAAPRLTPLIQAARRVNRNMPSHVIDLFDHLTNGTDVRKVAILGASYKANVGDDRESPSLEVAQLLADRGIDVAIHDQYVQRYSCSLESVLQGADAILLLTDHRSYQQIDPIKAARCVAHRLLLDTRGHLNAPTWRTAGFTVLQLGSGPSKEVPAVV